MGDDHAAARAYGDHFAEVLRLDAAYVKRRDFGSNLSLYLRDVSEIEDGVVSDFHSPFSSRNLPTQPMSYVPAAKSGWLRIYCWKGMVVLMPWMVNSPSARFIRAMAISRVAPVMMSLAIIES